MSGDLINAIDWSASSLGPVASWPSSLKTIIATMLRSRHPMFLFWGPDLIQFYNDAYLPSFGVGKHPAAMGQRGADCWGEIWPIIWPQIDDVMARGRASWNMDALVPIFRNGRIEEVYWTYGYSPACDEQGNIVGTLVVCTETTPRVVAQRRLAVTRRVADATHNAKHIPEIATAMLAIIKHAALDIPVVLHCAQDPLTGATHVQGSIEAEGGLDPHLKAEVSRAVQQAGLEDALSLVTLTLPKRDAAAVSPWPEPVSQFVVARPKTSGIGTFIFGISPRLAFDDAYRAFLHDVLSQIDLAASRVMAFQARASVEIERRNLLLHAPVATALMTGPQHVYELANARYIQIIGGRDLLGKAYTEAFPELIGTPLPGILDRVYQTGEPFVTEEYRVALDRQGLGVMEDCVFRFNLEPIRDGAGEPYGLMVVAVDITELVNGRSVLEQKDAERRVLLEQLKAANHAKDEFLATVSHELRTPLNAILGWVRMLRSGDVPPEKVGRAYETIERNSLSQVQLIEDLLDISRIISGKLRLDVQTFALAPVIEAALESMQHGIDAKSIRLIKTIDPNAGPISGDVQRIQQVIWNLLSNAVKFTPKGGTVRLIVQRVDSSVTITMSDSGQGIPPDLLGSVFDRFKQADGSAARIHGGLGLGLAIVRHIIELHGGTITAHSDGEGRGATFTVHLPVAALRVKPADPFRHPVLEGGPARLEHPRELQGLNVLVVDDEPDAREMLTELLNQCGSSVLQAGSAQEALAILDQASPRVMVCDIGMPTMDGYALIEKIRQRPADKGGRILAVALTAYASVEDRRRALRSGFQMHVTKPVEPAELVAMLASLAQLALALPH